MKVQNRFVVVQRVDVDLAAVSQLHAEHRSFRLGFPVTNFAFAPLAPRFFVQDFDITCMGGQQLNLLLWQMFLGEQSAEVIVVIGNQPVAVMCDLSASDCRKVETEAEKNLGTLLQLVLVGDFVDAKLLAASSAFSASISQYIQFRPHLTVRAKQVTGSITLARTHLEFEVRQQSVCVDNHCGSGKGLLKIVSIVLLAYERHRINV